MFLDTVFLSRKISTLIFGQVNSILSKTDFRLVYGKSQRENLRALALARRLVYLIRKEVRAEQWETRKLCPIALP